MGTSKHTSPRSRGSCWSFFGLIHGAPLRNAHAPLFCDQPQHSNHEQSATGCQSVEVFPRLSACGALSYMPPGGRINCHNLFPHNSSVFVCRSRSRDPCRHGSDSRYPWGGSALTPQAPNPNFSPGYFVFPFFKRTSRLIASLESFRLSVKNSARAPIAEPQIRICYVNVYVTSAIFRRNHEQLRGNSFRTRTSPAGLFGLGTPLDGATQTVKRPAHDQKFVPRHASATPPISKSRAARMRILTPGQTPGPDLPFTLDWLAQKSAAPRPNREAQIRSFQNPRDLGLQRLLPRPHNSRHTRRSRRITSKNHFPKELPCTGTAGSPHRTRRRPPSQSKTNRARETYTTEFTVHRKAP